MRTLGACSATCDSGIQSVSQTCMQYSGFGSAGIPVHVLGHWTHIVMADIVMACVVMAYVVMARTEQYSGLRLAGIPVQPMAFAQSHI